MQGYNLIVVFAQDAKQMLMCKRKKQPYKGLYNFVGGKIEQGEAGLHAAYRELNEETGIRKEDIRLVHLMDFVYHVDDCLVEVYAGQLNRNVEVTEEANTLLWMDLEHDFFDKDKFAGEGNIGHIMEHVYMSWDKIKESK